MAFERTTPEELKTTLHANGRKGLALDIDDTLCNTDIHWIEQMTARFGNPSGLTRTEIMEQYDALEEVPGWGTEEALAAVEEFMHSDDFQETIPIIENADTAVKAIDAIIPIVAYITARPESVIEGTRRWLSKHGFPDAPIIVRPLTTTHAEKNMWKARILHELYPEVAGIIDDHPGLVPQLEELGYQGKACLYNNGCNAKRYDHMNYCTSWDEVVTRVKDMFA